MLAKIVYRSLGSNPNTCAVTVPYTVASKSYKEEIVLDKSQYDHLQKGQTEIILVDSQNPNAPVLYRYCFYNAVLAANKRP